MLIRSRSARFAALALAAATPLVASYAAPAGADDGDDAVVTAVVTEGNVHVESTKGLSRVTVVLCDGAPLVADNWEGNQLIGDIEFEGVVQAVFIHSGSNTTAEAQALLAELAGADAVKGDSTGAIAFHDEEVCDDPGDDGDDPGDDGDDPGDDADDPTTTTDPDPVTTTAGPSTDVLGVTLDNSNNPATAPASPVAGKNLEIAGGELPRTGSAHVQFLMTLALCLIGAGVMLRAAFGRRIRSASSPG